MCCSGCCLPGGAVYSSVDFAPYIFFFPARASQAVSCTGTPAQVFFVASYIWPGLEKFACIVILLMGKFCCCMLFYDIALRLPDGLQTFSQEAGLCLFVTTVLLLLLLLVPGLFWC